MKIGRSQILTCPHCGKTKEIMHLQSGNISERKCWSDTKLEARMRPEASIVQKCPHCGKYYFAHNQEFMRSDDSYSTELGTLTFEESVEALSQLQEEGFDERDEYYARELLVYAYNDKYYRNDNGQKAPVSSEDFECFKANVIRLIELLNFERHQLRIAELYREIGDFSKCEEILESVTDIDDRLAKIKEEIMGRCRQKDNKVFCILNTYRNH